MKRAPVLILALLAATSVQAAPQSPAERAAAWWGDIAAIADDKTEGRLPGSPGYQIAADYVVARFQALGLAPAGDNGGFAQAVAFEQQTIDYPASSASLVAPGGQVDVLKTGSDLLISAGGAGVHRLRPAPARAGL
jgi:hypothetical protein